MIHVEAMVTKYGKFRAVDGLSFNVAPGESVALWGPNGAGKTTIIRSLLGLVRCKGVVKVDGKDARRNGKAARRAIGYVPQELAFYDDFGALEALRFFAGLKRVSKDRAPVILETVGLAGHGRKRIRELSGGMKQRLALGLALLADPPLLILDEPTSNLDADARTSFLALLENLHSDGKAILFSSHQVGEVQGLADRVLLLESGKLRQSCKADEFTDAAGVRCGIKLYLEQDSITAAVEALAIAGYKAERNCTGVHVEAPSHEKAKPIGILERKGIAVRDIEVLSDKTSAEIEQVGGAS